MEQIIKAGQAEISGLTKRDDLVIHSIPKRFINSKQGGDEHHRGMGVLILGFGAIILIAGIVLVYFFVFKKSGVIEVIVNNDVVSVKKTDILEELNANQVGSDESKVQEKKQQVVASEKTVSQGATSTEANAGDKIAVSDEKVEVATSSEIKRIEIELIDDEPVEKMQKILFVAPIDSDQDGLFDPEEMLLSTNVNMSDSDGDTYGDLDELKKLYNPAGSGKIILNNGIEKYTNLKYGYSFYYPKDWQIEKTNTEETLVLKINDNQFFQVIIASDTNGTTISDWYQSQFETTNIKASQFVYKTGWNGVKSGDGLVYYLNNPKNTTVFALTYSVSEGVARSYENIIEMIIASLELTN